jgi:hypothetical protein
MYIEHVDLFRSTALHWAINPRAPVYKNQNDIDEVSLFLVLYGCTVLSVQNTTGGPCLVLIGSWQAGDLVSVGSPRRRLLVPRLSSRLR